MSIPVYEGEMKNVAHLLRVEAMQTRDQNGGPQFVEFYPYLESYSESYESDWETEKVYGRMDGINNFNGVTRVINLSLKIVAYDLEQAKENQLKLSKMIRFLYPGVSASNNINNIKVAPVLRLKFASLILDNTTNEGLYGFIPGGFNIQPDHKSGYFTPVLSAQGSDGRGGTQSNPRDARREMSILQELDGAIFFKYVDISFSFHVLHNHILGHDVDFQASQAPETRVFSEYFPYGINGSDLAEGDLSLNPSFNLAILMDEAGQSIDPFETFIQQQADLDPGYRDILRGKFYGQSWIAGRLRGIDLGKRITQKSKKKILEPNFHRNQNKF